MYKTKEYSYDDLKDLVAYFLKEDSILKQTVDSFQDELQMLRNDFEIVQTKFKNLIQKRENEINEHVITEIKNRHLTKREVELDIIVDSLSKQVKNLRYIESLQKKKMENYKKRCNELKANLENEKRQNRQNEEKILQNALNEQTRLDRHIEELEKNLEANKCEHSNCNHDESSKFNRYEHEQETEKLKDINGANQILINLLQSHNEDLNLKIFELNKQNSDANEYVKDLKKQLLSMETLLQGKEIDESNKQVVLLNKLVETKKLKYSNEKYIKDYQREVSYLAKRLAKKIKKSSKNSKNRRRLEKKIDNLTKKFVKSVERCETKNEIDSDEIITIE